MFKQDLLLLVYNKDVVCIIDKGKDPKCETVAAASRRTDDILNNKIPSHDPYIPRTNAVFYNCSSLECTTVTLRSITQVTSPSLYKLKSCHKEDSEYKCETIRYNHFKNIDKLLFLKNNIQNKKFYLVDCLIYRDKGRICHKKDRNATDSHAQLVDTGTLARPSETNILAQDEFICEESQEKVVNCDIDQFVPFNDGLKLKESVEIKGDVLLKSGSYVVILKKNCFDDWCGFSGSVAPTRRWHAKYEPPGGAIFRCYYANKQQICKMLISRNDLEAEQRNWLHP